MLVIILLLALVVAVLLFGRPVDGADTLYYDAEFEQVETDDTELGEDDIPADSEAIPSSDQAGEVDTTALAEDIYNGADL